MKYLIILLLLISSCTYKNNLNSPEIKDYSLDNIVTIEQDSCEYVIYQGYKCGGIIHKQNCKFCKQRNKH